MFERGLVDEIFIYISPMILGGGISPTFVDGTGFYPKEVVPLKLLSFDIVDDVLALKYALKQD